MTAATCIAGIDPGASGAFAIYYPAASGRIVAHDMPLADGEVAAPLLADMLRMYAPTFVMIERAAARPGQGVVSMFNFGRACGDGIPTRYVTPQAWKKHFRLSSDKEHARALSLRLFPACAEHFKLKRNHGKAEAALIAKFAAETIGGAT